MPPTLLNLTATDFDAYLPDRATSNAFVRARIPVKDKLVTAARALAERVRERAGIDLDVVGSDERPSIWNKKSVTAQWVFLWRNREAREELDRAMASDRPLEAALADPTPFYRHAFVALHLTAQSFEVTFQMHHEAWADTTHLGSRLASEAGRAAVDGALQSLTEAFDVGVADGVRRAASKANAGWVEEALRDAQAASSALVVSRSWGRDAAIDVGEALWDRVVESVDALVPVYQVMAWRRDGDMAVVTAELDRRRVEREAHAADLAARTAAWEANHDAEIERRRGQAVIETRERVAALEPSRPSMVQAATAGLEAPAERPRPPSQRPQKPAAPAPQATPRAATAPMRSESAPPQVSTAPTEWADSDAPVLPGARVRVTSGPFEGKTGLVIGVDAKGQAKVMVGAVSVRVDVGLLTRVAPKA